MTTRYDLVTPRQAKNSDRTFFTKVGVAFPNRNGDGFTLTFEALPIGNAEGEVRVLMMPHKDKEVAPVGGGGRPTSRDDSDEIPFMPEWR